MKNRTVLKLSCALVSIHRSKKQVDVVLLLKARCNAALPALITHA